jgi:hypothetical protein
MILGFSCSFWVFPAHSGFFLLILGFSRSFWVFPAHPARFPAHSGFFLLIPGLFPLIFFQNSEISDLM